LAVGLVGTGDRLSFILLLDPLNAMRGWPSITGDLARGDWRRLWSLLASGLGVRRAVGVLELPGAVKVDVHCSLFWKRKDFRDAGARLPGLSTVRDRMLGDLYLLSFTAGRQT